MDLLTTQEQQRLIEALRQFAPSKAVVLFGEPTVAGALGEASWNSGGDGTITLRPGLTPLGAFAVYVHEWAHVVGRLHYGGGSKLERLRAEQDTHAVAVGKLQEGFSPSVAAGVYDVATSGGDVSSELPGAAMLLLEGGPALQTIGQLELVHQARAGNGWMIDETIRQLLRRGQETTAMKLAAKLEKVAPTGRYHAAEQDEFGMGYMHRLDAQAPAPSQPAQRRSKRNTERAAQIALEFFKEDLRLTESLQVGRMVEGSRGGQWRVQLIGGNTVTVLGVEMVESLNGRLYPCAVLEQSAKLFEGIKVYDNHLTDAEFSRKQGMRSVKNELVGAISHVKWDPNAKALTGLLHVIDSNMREKLANAAEAGVLDSIGLSIDVFGKHASRTIADKAVTVVESISKAISVDVVGDPAAGGRFLGAV